MESIRFLVSAIGGSIIFVGLWGFVITETITPVIVLGIGALVWLVGRRLTK